MKIFLFYIFGLNEILIDLLNPNKNNLQNMRHIYEINFSKDEGKFHEKRKHSIFMTTMKC